MIGDTAVLYTDKGFHTYEIMKVRLAGIDAPEMRPRVGSPAARTAEKALALASTNRLKELIEGREIIVQTRKTGKFGRQLAVCFLPDSDKTANDLLLEEGLAVVYGTPRPWREDEAKLSE